MVSFNMRLEENHKEFLAKNEMLGDMAIAHMAQDIEIRIKTGGKTPYKKGPLRDETYHEKLANQKFQVVAPVEYAEVQEKGMRRGARPFTTYTTAGTGKGWFADAAATVTKDAESYFEEAGKIMGVT